MTQHDVRREDRDRLARFLGWFSIGLGSAQLAAPRALCRLVGADAEGRAPLVMRVMGLRELAQGTGILTRPRPTMWVWSRVVGDALDLALLGRIAAENRRARTAFAIANVAMVAAPDFYEARHLARKRGEPRSGKLIRKAVTIRKSLADVETAAAEVRQKVESAGGSLSFADAPGGRGVEVVAEFRFDPPFGEFGAVAAKLTGSDLATQLADDLRLLKQELETGQPIRSDASPHGHDLVDHLKQRAAQPVEEVQQ